MNATTVKKIYRSKNAAASKATGLTGNQDYEMQEVKHRRNSFIVRLLLASMQTDAGEYKRMTEGQTIIFSPTRSMVRLQI